MTEAYLAVGITLIALITLGAAITAFAWYASNDIESWVDDIGPWVGVGTLGTILWPGVVAVVAAALALAVPAGLVYCVYLALKRFWFERDGVNV